jgi:DNA polymerase-1
MAPRADLYLVDGSSQMYRAYHAIRGLTGPDGRSTNAVYGFVTMLRKLLADHAPEYIAAAFDLPGPTFRTELAADYKANRAPMPPDLAEQIPLVHEACEALGVPVLTHERFEADDIIGTLARQAADAGLTVAIVTGDKDFFQLVGERVLVFNPRDEGTWYDEEGVKARFGVAASQVVDVLALMGDAIDNVKGVPGIGEKGARDLIAAYGSLDALLDGVDSVPQRKYREALAAHAEAARRSRDLVRIRTDVPVSLDLEALRFRGASRERCYELFTRLGFRSLVADYAPTAEAVARDYRIVASRAALDELAAAMRRAGRAAIHVLADGAGAMDATPLGIAVSIEPRQAAYVPWPAAPGEPAASGAPPAGGLFDAPAAGSAGAAGADVPAGASGAEARPTRSDIDAALKPVLEDPAVRKVGHDLKTAAIVLARQGIDLAGLEDDTLLASYVIDATRSSHRLEDLALEQLGYRALDDGALVGRGGRASSFAAVSEAVRCDYAGERADLAGQLAPRLRRTLEEEGVGRIYRELELPLVPVLVEIERTGVCLDVEVLREISKRLDRELEERRARIYELAGMEFNINSPRQLAEVLFDKLQLPASRRTGKTRAASTAVEVLEELAAVHPLPREILEWRGVQKLKGTYVDALPVLVRADTGRLHTTFNQAVAATGRLSSSDPNLQNIPIRTELGREIRRAFVADRGRVLVSADYSQIELRVLAHLSGDERLVEAFRRGEDIHDRTAQAVFGTASGLDPYELRRRAKIVNYALLYGKTAFTLARDIGVSQQAAQAFIDAYFAGFPGVRRFIDETLARARETGVVTTLWGRRRLVPEIASRNGQIRAAAERVAVNMPIQGTAADILKRAMIDVHAALAGAAGGGARMILTVHDELVFEAPEDAGGEVAALVKTHMERAASLAVPLTVEVGIGKNWLQAKG